MSDRRLARFGYLAIAALDSALAGSARPATRRARFVTKPLLMPMLVAAHRPGVSSRRAGLRAGTTTGQLLSWGGDLALLGTSERAFLGGLGSVVAAHVAYIAAFGTVRDPVARISGTGTKTAALAWLATAPTMAVAAGRKDASLPAPIVAYAAALATMFATSTALDARLPRKARRTVVLGTSLFLLSDSLLGLQEFVLGARSPRLEAAVMATYTAGQWFIAAGVADALRAEGT
jgi:uncharacterized membrane protein YhhN